MIAEIVGREGRVVSVDIDPEVVRRAAELLDEAGYGARVQVRVTDAEHGVPGEARFDAIIVTAGAWDISPAWLDQLAADGILVLPLIMNAVTRTIGFRRDGDHLVSTSAEVAGFVPMQGDGRHSDRVLVVPDSSGHKIRLSFDSGFPAEPSSLDGVLAEGRTDTWSGVTIRHGVSFADLHLWFACYLEGFCRLVADEGSDLAGERGTWFPFGVVRGPGFAYLVVRPALDGAGVEFGARGCGRDGQLAATAMAEQVLAWDRQGRHTEPIFGYWAADSDRSRLPADAAVMAKAHGVVTIAWPAADLHPSSVVPQSQVAQDPVSR
jgi:protein-L-isoaspartate(D-aspartate) O-methyltransferase